MLIPIRTDRPARRRPVVTEGLILANMLVFLGGLMAEFAGAFDRGRLVELGALSRDGFAPYRLLTYQFLHDPSSIWHLAFNLLFLWVFGGAVEDRMGRASFLGFYLGGGVLAGIAHMLLHPAPVIGASGAVAGVSGAFLCLFPRARIQVLLFFFLIGIYAIPAAWVIGFYFALDLLRQTTELLGGGGSRTAYAAHLAGYVWGFSVAFALLALKVLPREDFDVFFLLTQRRRRAAFRRAAKGSPSGGFESASADTAHRLERERTRRHAGGAPRPGPSDAMRAATAEARTEIARLVAEHRVPEAADRYLRLLEIAPDSVLSAEAQLDVANHLAAEGRSPEAAAAYEGFLRTQAAHPHAHAVRLLLASVCLRSLADVRRAKAALEGVRESVLGPGERDLLADLRRSIEAGGEGA